MYAAYLIYKDRFGSICACHVRYGRKVTLHVSLILAFEALYGMLISRLKPAHPTPSLNRIISTCISQPRSQTSEPLH